MKSAGKRADIEVCCPDCEVSFEVSPEVIEESQHMLDEQGYCTGLASFECPAPYFAALAPAAAVHPKRAAVNLLDRAIARWESEGGASAPSR